MQHINTRQFRGEFTPIASSRAVQAAVMILRPGAVSSAKLENEHPRSEQWLLVIAGIGKARVGKRTVSLSVGSLLLIEKDEPHQITNTGRSMLRTINFYAPPAYAKDGEVK